MTRTSKILSLVATVCALPTGLLHAQSVRVEFTTSFPFYVAGQKMPAGFYKATMSNINDQWLLIRDANGSHSVIVQYDPTQSIEPVAQGLAKFHQYGDAY